MASIDIERAKEIAKCSVPVILLALHMKCFGENGSCDDCVYLNKSDCTCTAIEKIAQFGEFLHPDRIPYGDRGWEDDPRAERRPWEEYE